MIEMTAPPLPLLQSAVDALFSRITAGRARATGTAVVSGLTGQVTDLTPDELAILEDAFGSRFGSRLSDIWMRDELEVAGASEDDWALENEIAWQAESRGYEGDPLHLLVERIMRAGPYRRKWDEARGAVSWLAQDVANAIKTTQDRRKKYENGPTPVLDEEFHPGDVPAEETIDEKVARLERENRRLRAANAVQMTVIRAHNDVEKRLRGEIERLNRQIYADYRLGKVKTLTSSQKDAIKAVARVGTKRAEHFDSDKPIITSQTLAAEMGKCAKTASEAAELVCSLPGSPITRAMAPGGKYGQVTSYELAVRDPVEILERFIVIAENMEAKVSSRPQQPKCRNHPNARLNTLHECSTCLEIVELQPLCGKVVRIAPSAPPVKEQVVIHGQVVRIADRPPEAPVSPADRRAGLFDLDPETPHSKPWRCRCGCMERYLVEGGYRCDGCGQTVTSAPAASTLQGRPGKLPDYFRLPDESEMGPPAPPDPTTWAYRPCCKESGMVFSLDDGRHPCVDCGAELRWDGGYLKLADPLLAAVAGGEE